MSSSTTTIVTQKRPIRSSFPLIEKKQDEEKNPESLREILPNPHIVLYYVSNVKHGYDYESRQGPIQPLTEGGWYQTFCQDTSIFGRIECQRSDTNATISQQLGLYFPNIQLMPTGSNTDTNTFPIWFELKQMELTISWTQDYVPETAPIAEGSPYIQIYIQIIIASTPYQKPDNIIFSRCYSVPQYSCTSHVIRDIQPFAVKPGKALFWRMSYYGPIFQDEEVGIITLNWHGDVIRRLDHTLASYS